MKEVCDFLKKCGVFYLATVEEGCPRVRPMGAVDFFEGKIYIFTDKTKRVSMQMRLNPKVELCAFDGEGAWVRIEAEAVNDDRIAPKEFLLDAYPFIKSKYSSCDDKTQVVFLKNVKTDFYTYSGKTKTIEG